MLGCLINNNKRLKVLQDREIELNRREARRGSRTADFSGFIIKNYRVPYGRAELGSPFSTAHGAKFIFTESILYTWMFYQKMNRLLLLHWLTQYLAESLKYDS